MHNPSNLLFFFSISIFIFKNPCRSHQATRFLYINLHYFIPILVKISRQKPLHDMKIPPVESRAQSAGSIGSSIDVTIPGFDDVTAEMEWKWRGVMGVGERNQAVLISAHTTLLTPSPVSRDYECYFLQVVLLDPFFLLFFPSGGKNKKTKTFLIMITRWIFSFHSISFFS